MIDETEFDYRLDALRLGHHDLLVVRVNNPMTERQRVELKAFLSSRTRLKDRQVLVLDKDTEIETYPGAASIERQHQQKQKQKPLEYLKHLPDAEQVSAWRRWLGKWIR